MGAAAAATTTISRRMGGTPATVGRSLAQEEAAEAKAAGRHHVPSQPVGGAAALQSALREKREIEDQLAGLGAADEVDVYMDEDELEMAEPWEDDYDVDWADLNASRHGTLMSGHLIFSASRLGAARPGDDAMDRSTHSYLDRSVHRYNERAMISPLDRSAHSMYTPTPGGASRGGGGESASGGGGMGAGGGGGIGGSASGGLATVEEGRA